MNEQRLRELRLLAGHPQPVVGGDRTVRLGNGLGESLDEIEEQARAHKEALLAMEGELQARQAEIDKLRDCLEGMCLQFGHVADYNGQKWVSTMGLSNLEWAFEVLGWTDPQPMLQASAEEP